LDILSNYEIDKSIEELNTSIIEESFLKHYFGDNYTIVEDKETQKQYIDSIQQEISPKALDEFMNIANKIYN